MMDLAGFLDFAPLWDSWIPGQLTPMMEVAMVQTAPKLPVPEGTAERSIRVIAAHMYEKVGQKWWPISAAYTVLDDTRWEYSGEAFVRNQCQRGAPQIASKYKGEHWFDWNEETGANSAWRVTPNAARRFRRLKTKVKAKKARR
jgi:hypothetical protein